MEFMIGIIIGSIVVVLLIIGIIGCFVPVMPGPPISYGALLIFHFFSSYNIDKNTLWLWALIVVVVTVFDLWVQIYGVKKFGGTQKAINGSIIGLLLGILIPIISIFIPIIGILIPIGPFGVIFGPFLGAFIGATMDDPDINKSLKIALGALAGLVLGTIVKLSVSLYIIYIIYESIPSLW